MSEIPTAEEILNRNYISTKENAVRAMIEFAKLHVEKALKEASKKAETIDTYKTRWNGINKESYVEKDIYPSSILDAYPLTNIK